MISIDKDEFIILSCYILIGEYGDYYRSITEDDITASLNEIWHNKLDIIKKNAKDIKNMLIVIENNVTVLEGW